MHEKGIKMNVAVGQNNEVRNEGLRIAGEKIYSDRVINVFTPYNGQLVGTVPMASQEDVRRAFSIAQYSKATPTRYQRSTILKRAPEITRCRPEDYYNITPDLNSAVSRQRVSL